MYVFGGGDTISRRSYAEKYLVISDLCVNSFGMSNLDTAYNCVKLCLAKLVDEFQTGFAS